jgi:ribosomal protein L5
MADLPLFPECLLLASYIKPIGSISGHSYCISKMNRLQKYYNTVICYDLLFKDCFINVMQLPKLNRIVLNTGLGLKAVTDKKMSLTAMLGHELISGQCPTITRAKKSIDKFKLREKMPIGCKVTLRNRRMYEFFDKLIVTVLPNLEEFTDFYLHSMYQQKGPIPLQFPFSGYSNGFSSTLLFPLAHSSSDFLSVKLKRSHRISLEDQILSLHQSAPSSSLVKSLMFRNPYFGPSAVDSLSILTHFPYFGSSLSSQLNTSSHSTSVPTNRSLSYGLGIKDFFRFKEIEYDKFESSIGLDILLILNPLHSLTLAKPKYFLSSFQMPL